MSDIASQLDEAARAGRLTAFSAYRTPEGRWQAQMRTNSDITTWRVEVRGTPAEAIAALFFIPGKHPQKPISSGVFD